MSIPSLTSKNALAFLFATVMFCAGFNNLQYGLSFIDEGMYLTDAWRVSQGDKLVEETAKFAPTLYQFFSSIIFLLEPDLSILSVRRIEHSTFALTLLLFIAAWSKQSGIRFSEVLLLTSPILFCGFDGTGRASSFSYYSVPLLIYYVIAIKQAKFLSPSEDFHITDAIILGTLHGCLAVAYLPAGITILSTAALISTSKRSRKKFKSLALLASTSTLPLLLLVATSPQEYINNLLGILKNNSSSGSTLSDYTAAYIATAVLFSGSLYLGDRISSRFGIRSKIAVGLITFIFTLGAITSRFNEMLPPFWNGWFNIPGLAGLIAITLISVNFLGSLPVWKKPLINLKDLNANETHGEWLISFSSVYMGILLFALSFSLTSSLGVLLFSNLLPIIIVLNKSLQIHFKKIGGSRNIPHTLTNPAIFAVCLSIAIHDYNFTYFDKHPRELTERIRNGPAAGIMTNPANASIIESLEKISDQLTTSDDLLISYDQTAMAYFLLRRKPSLDHSWTGITGNNNTLLEASIIKMKRLNKEPELVMHWRNKMLWFPLTSIDQATLFYWPSTLSGFGDSQLKPLNDYVTQNFDYLGSIKINEERAIDIFRRRR